MEENKTENLSTNSEAEKKNIYKNGDYKTQYVKVTFTRAKLAEMAQLAEKHRFRKAGIKLWKARPHGFAGEELPNRKGIAALIERMIIPEWIAAAAQRELERKQVEEKAKALGLLPK